MLWVLYLLVMPLGSLINKQLSICLKLTSLWNSEVEVHFAGEPKWRE